MIPVHPLNWGLLFKPSIRTRFRAHKSKRCSSSVEVPGEDFVLRESMAFAAGVYRGELGEDGDSKCKCSPCKVIRSRQKELQSRNGKPPVLSKHATRGAKQPPPRQLYRFRRFGPLGPLLRNKMIKGDSSSEPQPSGALSLVEVVLHLQYSACTEIQFDYILP